MLCRILAAVRVFPVLVVVLFYRHHQLIQLANLLVW